MNTGGNKTDVFSNKSDAIANTCDGFPNFTAKLQALGTDAKRLVSKILGSKKTGYSSRKSTNQR